jgi:alkanesulfonate monooxygenase SsuD/methylene tetrahydromethanopterin reductase-like flavin-dependent oxidoreductase (luciferase family)
VPLALEDEQLGFDIRYFGDNHSLHPDPFVALLDAARVTGRIKLATGIVTTVTRHPAVLANLAAPLQLASNGRAILGIGKGDSVVAMLGKRPQEARRIRREHQVAALVSPRRERSSRQLRQFIGLAGRTRLHARSDRDRRRRSSHTRRGRHAR